MLLLQTLQLVSDLGQRTLFLCALVFCDTLKKKKMGEERDCISSMGTSSEDATLRAKSVTPLGSHVTSSR